MIRVKMCDKEPDFELDFDEILHHSKKMCEKAKTRLEAVTGLDRAKERLIEWLVLPYKYPQLFSGVRRPHGHILLYGLPGVGKSMLLNAMLGSLPGSVNIYWILACELRTEKHIRQLFDHARDRGPSVIVLNEMESLFSERNSPQVVGRCMLDRQKTELFLQTSHSSNAEKNLTVIVITQQPWALPPFLRRMLSRRMYIALQDLEGRKEEIKYSLQEQDHSLTDTDIHEIGLRTHGFTGADITCVFRSSAMAVIRELQKTEYFKLQEFPGPEGPCEKYVGCTKSEEGATALTLFDMTEDNMYIRPMSMDDVREELKRSRSSVYSSDLEKHERFIRDFGHPDDEKFYLKEKSNACSYKGASRLQYLCKNVIRTQLSGYRSVDIEELDLPRAMKLYLWSSDDDFREPDSPDSSES